jgi:hypothetical protein
MKVHDLLKAGEWRIIADIDDSKTTHGENHKKMSYEGIADYLLKYCGDAVDNLLLRPIVRSQETGAGEDVVIFADPRKGLRQSANTTNHYTVIFDHVLPPEFPRRSKSLICGNYGNPHAWDYGEPFALFPHDGVKIGVCPDEDMFETEVRIFGNTFTVPQVNDILSTLEISDDSFDEIVEHLSIFASLDKKDIAKKNIEIPSFKHAISRFKTLPGMSKDAIRDEIIKAYSNASLKATTTKLLNPLGKNELWVGGPCILIPMERYLKDVLPYLKQKGVSQ